MPEAHRGYRTSEAGPPKAPIIEYSTQIESARTHLEVFAKQHRVHGQTLVVGGVHAPPRSVGPPDLASGRSTEKGKDPFRGQIGASHH